MEHLSTCRLLLLLIRRPLSIDVCVWRVGEGPTQHNTQPPPTDRPINRTRGRNRTTRKGKTQHTSIDRQGGFHKIAQPIESIFRWGCRLRIDLGARRKVAPMSCRDPSSSFVADDRVLRNPKVGWVRKMPFDRFPLLTVGRTFTPTNTERKRCRLVQPRRGREGDAN